MPKKHLWLIRSLFLRHFSQRHPRSTKIEKSDFFRILSKKYFFSEFLWQKIVVNIKAYTWKSCKKNPSNSSNINCISDIGQKGRPKSEKNRGKLEHFSGTLSEWFLKTCIFSIEEIYQNLWEKYQILQKESNSGQEKCSILFGSKTEIWNFTQCWPNFSLWR